MKDSPNDSDDSSPSTHSTIVSDPKLLEIESLKKNLVFYVIKICKAGSLERIKTKYIFISREINVL